MSPNLSSIPAFLDGVCELFRHVRFNFSNEEELQLGAAELLKHAGYVFERERVLDARSRVDFYFPIGVGLEVKVDGSPTEILRQVQRYAMHPDIHGLVILSRRANVCFIPDMLQGKPVRIISLWSSNL